ncbi:hypothetical protein VPH35_027071 [Triticum aestivum]
MHDFSSRIYSLCRIDARKHLFYENLETARRAAQLAMAKKSKRGELAAMGGCKRLPRPAINFQASPSIHNKTTAYLFSILGGESNILYSDNNCQTALCNLDMNIIDPFAPPNSFKSWNAISLPITSPKRPLSLYVLDLSPAARPSCCFEVLSRRENELALPKEWNWEILPPPPFFYDPKTAPDLYSYAVVDGSTICISSLEKAIGTYTFDTVGKKWSQAAHWALPFFGRVEYVPELGLCAFSNLCALDLSAMDHGQPSKLQYTWDYIDLPRKSLLRCQFATFFGTELGTCGMSAYHSDYEATFCRECAAFTGLEVKRGNDGEGPLEFIKHMSKGFSVGDRNIECVL